ncbi:MAG TPA: hypothetical protein VJJ77_06335, partial [Dongiaceae bacterium]|nr:hypothetical protein [Dongiaceae bacterium]
MKDKCQDPGEGIGTAFKKKWLATAAIGALVAGAGGFLSTEGPAAEGDCVGASAVYDRALLIGTEEALQDFLRQYPDCLALALLAPSAGEPLDPDSGGPEGDPEGPSGGESGGSSSGGSSSGGSSGGSSSGGSSSGGSSSGGSSSGGSSSGGSSSGGSSSGGSSSGGSSSGGSSSGG